MCKAEIAYSRPLVIANKFVGFRSGEEKRVGQSAGKL